MIFFSGHKVCTWRSNRVAIFLSAKTITLQGSDVTSRAKDMSFMADKKKSCPGKTNCAAGGPGAVNCVNKTDTLGITMHYLPKDETLQQNWTWFIRIHRKDFVPTKSPALCSVHFNEMCFHSLDESEKPVNQKRHLIPGSGTSKDTVVPHTFLLSSRKCRVASR